MMHDLLNLIVPSTCAGCRAWDTSLCDRCRQLHRNSIPVAVEMSENRELSGRAIGEYSGYLRRITLAAKHDSRRDLSRWLFNAGIELGEHVRIDHEVESVAVIPIPSGIARYWRGMLITPTIARGVVAGLQRSGVCASMEPVLAMKRRTRTQAGKNRSERRQRRNVFRLRGVAASRACVLVDDVITTGTTIREAVSILEQHGDVVVAVATVAIVPTSSPHT
ncbi:MAG: phosphoribosyltransferase family protein [Actinomycetaceae bacterium]|nr:phosphoribosyltransferase family protein [Actinomycetaceae bacterium]